MCKYSRFAKQQAPVYHIDKQINPNNKYWAIEIEVLLEIIPFPASNILSNNKKLLKPVKEFEVSFQW